MSQKPHFILIPRNASPEEVARLINRVRRHVKAKTKNRRKS